MHPIAVGSIVFGVVAVVLLIISQIKINSLNLNQEGSFSSERVSNELKSSHKCTACVTIIIGTICCWTMWVCCYMHQMHPLIRPILEKAE